tara:strand:+ start:180 stop:413 length:234 start_codon:yes stop_codon:yes gene_type:complete
MYFTEIIIGALVLSILVVLISIFYVLFSSPGSSPGSSPVKKTQKNKIKKIKYTKEFLKGVNGIDLDLKIDTKKTSTK